VKKKPRKLIGWSLGSLGAILLAGLLFYVFNPRWFGERYIHFDGAVSSLRPLGSDHLLVVEDVQTGGGEDGPMRVGYRWRIVESTAGKALFGPHYVDLASWVTVQGDRLVSMHARDLEVRSLDNALLGAMASFRSVPNLRRDWNEVSVGEDGEITAMSDDGRFYRLDVKTFEATLVPARPQRAHAWSLQQTSAVSGLSLVGMPRARVNGRGRDYLEPQWVIDPSSRKPIEAGRGHLLLHGLRMQNSPNGRGPILSAVDASGDEAWQDVLPFGELYGVVVVGDLLLLALNERPEIGPALLRAIDRASGKERWRLAL